MSVWKKVACGFAVMLRWTESLYSEPCLSLIYGSFKRCLFFVLCINRYMLIHIYTHIPSYTYIYIYTQALKSVLVVFQPLLVLMVNSGNMILHSGEKLGWKEYSWDLFLRNMATMVMRRLCSVETGVVFHKLHKQRGNCSEDPVYEEACECSPRACLNPPRFFSPCDQWMQLLLFIS